MTSTQFKAMQILLLFSALLFLNSLAWSQPPTHPPTHTGPLKPDKPDKSIKPAVDLGKKLTAHIVDKRIMTSYFTKEQIMALIDTTLPPLCSDCHLDGLIFKIALKKISDNGTTKHYQEILKAYRAEWDGNKKIVFSEPMTTTLDNIGTDRTLVDKLDDEFKDAAKKEIPKFDLVFFKIERLEELVNYTLTNGIKSDGIILARLRATIRIKVGNQEKNVPFQSLTAYTNPNPFFGDVVTPSVAFDQTHSKEDGTPCPPAWDPDGSAPNVISSTNVNLSKVLLKRNQKVLTANMMTKAFLKQYDLTSVAPKVAIKKAVVKKKPK